MILNIHGYKGSSENAMYRILAELFPGKGITSPQLDYDAMTPSEIRKALDSLISEDVELITGTSLGGFFAADLWARHKTIPAILLNPALRPWEQLTRLGYAGNDSLNAEYQSVFEDARLNAEENDKDNFYVISGKNDEVVGVIDPLGFSMGYEEFCQSEDNITIGAVAMTGVWRPINVHRIDCGHSAAGDTEAIDQIKEIILTLHHNGYSNRLAIEDERDYHLSEIVLLQKEIIIQMAEELDCDYEIINEGDDLSDREDWEPLYDGITAVWSKHGFTQIRIEGDDITKLPESIGKLTTLKYLVITCPGISRLPESIGNLSELERSCFDNTAIAELPESIGKITGLRTLSLRNTGISKLPESIKSMTGLMYLNISGTKMTELPECVGDFTELVFLGISNTGISKLPEGVSTLRNLERLSIKGSAITDLPESIRSIPGLTILE